MRRSRVSIAHTVSTGMLAGRDRSLAPRMAALAGSHATFCVDESRTAFRTFSQEPSCRLAGRLVATIHGQEHGSAPR